jgi:hypothetical protein
LALLITLWQTFLSNTPTCFDGILNNDEKQVDCGGSCARICPVDTRSPVVLWDRTFETSSSIYSAAAYVENRNVAAYAEEVPYSFKLYDERGILVTEVLGTTDIPPVGLVPIVEAGINSGNRRIASVDFAFGREEIVWQRNTEELPTLRTTQQQLEPNGARLTATLVNDSILEARDTAVIAVLFDASGVARAASKTVVPRLRRQSSEPLIFTWPNGVPNIVRAEITVLPSL